MQFAREILFDVIEEIQPMLQRHYEELCLRPDVIKLEPRWGAYASLEQAGSFVVLTARKDGRLVGYSAYFLNAHLHYAGLKVAQNDVFYVSEEHRKGMAPARFLRYCERTLKEMGTHKIVYHAKQSNNLAPLLNRLGYGSEEVMCGKLLIGD